MRKLEGRIIALERRHGDLRLAHISDAELEARFVATCKEIEALGGALAPAWREHLVAGAFQRIIARMPCAA